MSDSRNGGVIIREARPEDAAALAALYHELVNNPAVTVEPARLAELATDRSNFLLVAESVERPGTLLGTVLVTLCKDVMFGTRPYAVLENIVVGASARNQRIGSRLLAAAEILARHHRCTRLAILSHVRRTDAHRFFIREGFDGERKRGFVKYLRDPAP